MRPITTTQADQKTEAPKKISSLVQDIKTVLQHGVEISDDQAKEFGLALAAVLKEKLKPRAVPDRGAIRMSNLGSPDRKLWYTVNRPKDAEELQASTYLKFIIGDIYEAVLLFLAKSSGHVLSYEQLEVDVLGVKGHPDALIDGELVDVKSASGYGMKKFENHKLETDDPFNYIFQLTGYLGALQEDEALVNKSTGHFLVADKSSGDIVLDSYQLKADKKTVEEIVQRKLSVVAAAEPPDRCYSPVPDGSSGNMKLNTECSYCVFKKTCWPELRTFIYSNGPRFLTTVVRTPDVLEVK